MTPLEAGNALTLLFAGDEYFPALEAEIAQAREEIHLETYIFADDATGRRIATALGDAAARGVRVRLLVDGFGAANLVQPLRDLMAPRGVDILVYRPERGWLRLRRHRLRRLHRKLAVIDRRVGFCGGINVLDDRDGRPEAAPRFDFAVRAEGPIVADMHRAVSRLWTLVEWTRLGHRPAPSRDTPRPARSPVSPGVRARFVVRDNLRHRRAIEEAYLGAIAKAKREVLLSNAYFLPGRAFRRALRDAVARGVRVRLLLQGNPDHYFVHLASRALYGSLIDAGIEIHTYQVTHLHAKVAVVDGHWSTVGSSNIDPFSLLLSREANIVADDARFAAQLREHLETAIATGALAIPRSVWAAQPWYHRAFAWITYQAGRAFLGLSGYLRDTELEL